jgi:hypothetical protein
MCRWVLGLLDLGDRPAEPDELAGRGDRDDRPAFVARFEPGPGAMQPALGAPGDRDSFCGLACLSVGQGLADGRRFTVVPGGFDEQPAGVRRSGLRDRPKPTRVPGR